MFYTPLCPIREDKLATLVLLTTDMRCPLCILSPAVTPLSTTRQTHHPCNWVELIGAWWCQSLVRAEELGSVYGCPLRLWEIAGVEIRGGAATGEEALEEGFVCVCVGGNKLSHCKKVCRSKSHLPTCTRAMPQGRRVRGQDTPFRALRSHIATSQ